MTGLVDLDSIRAAIVKGLKEHLKIPVVRSNQTGEPPAYPYLSYTIVNLMNANNGTWGEYEDGKDRNPTTQTWSITVQSDNASEAMELTIKAHDWLDRVGTVYLNDNGVIAQSLTSISNRDNMITIEYEYRHGFDVVFWLLNEVQSTTKETGYIDEAVINNVPYTREYDVDELNMLLEQRLDGVV